MSVGELVIGAQAVLAMLPFEDSSLTIKMPIYVQESMKMHQIVVFILSCVESLSMAVGENKPTSVDVDSYSRATEVLFLLFLCTNNNHPSPIPVKSYFVVNTYTYGSGRKQTYCC